MLIKGLQKTTLLDYPEKVACTLFTGECNFRCPFCHNAALVLQPHTIPTISEEEFFLFLEKRKNILDGVCITGGEPLLQNDILLFCQKIHELGLSVKLDTNGVLSDRLKKLIDAHAVDYIAMDIKNAKYAYAETCGLASFPQGVEYSIHFIMESEIPYEFRTTLVKELHSPERMASLAQWIQGAKQYFLQNFTDSGNLIGNGLSAFSTSQANQLLEIVKQYIPSAKLRGD